MDELKGGALENVTATPATEYVFFCWYTPDTYTFVEFSESGAKAKLNTVCDPLPVKLAIVASPDTIVPTLSNEPINTPVLVSRTYL